MMAVLIISPPTTSKQMIRPELKHITAAAWQIIGKAIQLRQNAMLCVSAEQLTTTEYDSTDCVTYTIIYRVAGGPDLATVTGVFDAQEALDQFDMKISSL